MRLSEAIMLGAMIRPQGFGHTFLNGKSCTIGAALEAAGVNIVCYSYWGEDWQHMEELFPYFREDPRGPMIVCPAAECACARSFVNYWECIAHVNDDHRWTRERIADWVATIEPPEEFASGEPRARRLPRSLCDDPLAIPEVQCK